MRRRLTAIVICAAGSTACVTPPAPPQPRAATAVHASFGKTWDAVIDEFAASNIPIRTMERSSGFIATDRLAASQSDTSYADCGKALGVPMAPTDAVYNVVVRGDSAGATVRTTVAWRRETHAGTMSKVTDCSSRGVWESKFEALAKGRAENK